MFGNLFNTRKGNKSQDEIAQGTQVSDTEIKVEQRSGGDLLGDTTKVSESIKQDVPRSISENPQARENVTALSRLDPRSTQVLNQAQQLAKKNGQQYITPEHLLFGLIYDGEIFKLLEQFSVDAARISQEIEAKQQKGDFTGQPTLSEGSKQILEEAYNTSKLRGSSFISPEDILLSIFAASETLEYLRAKGIEKQGIEDKLSKSLNYTVPKKSNI